MGLAEGVTFISLYVLACVAFLPISPLTLGAGVLFGVWKGFALVWCGATLGACASFLLGRYLLRGWVEERAERWPLFGAIRKAATRQGWRVVFLTRLAPVFPFTFLNYGYGLTRISLGEFALASFLGMAPCTFLFVYVGATAGEAWQNGRGPRTPGQWALTAGAVAAAGLAVWLVSREARKALAETAGIKPSGG